MSNKKEAEARISHLLRTHPERMASKLTYGAYGRYIVSLMGFGYRHGTAWSRFMRPIGQLGLLLMLPAVLVLCDVGFFDLRVYLPPTDAATAKLGIAVFYSLWLHAALIHFPAKFHDSLWRLLVSRGRPRINGKSFAGKIVNLLFPDALERILTRSMSVLSLLFIFDLWRRSGYGALVIDRLGQPLAPQLEFALLTFSFYFLMVVLIGLAINFTEKVVLMPRKTDGVSFA